MTATIHEKLTQAWSRERRFFHLRGVARMVPWLIGMFLFDLLLDWSFDLPGSARLLLLFANLALLGWLLYRHWLSYLRRFNPTRVSLQVERLHPRLNNLLVSYVQLSAESDPAHGSRQMILAMRSQAEKAAGPLDFNGIVNFRSLRKLLALSGSMLVLFLASSVFAGEYYAALLGRMLVPFGSFTYPTRTRIVDLYGPVAVKQGDEAILQARAVGEIPEQGMFYTQVENASWEKFPLTKGEENIFRHRIPKAGQSFQYYFRIGDARTAPSEVKVVPPPRVVQTTLTLRYPSYTGRDAKVSNRLQLESAVPEGTIIEWTLRCDQPLKAGAMHFGGLSPRDFDFEIDPTDPHVARKIIPDAGLLLDEKDRNAATTLYYHFEWTEKEHGFTFKDATRYALEVTPDKAPLVILLKPRPSGSEQDKILATTRKNVHLIFDASDDYGLDKASLIYWVNKEAQSRAPVSLGTFFQKEKDESLKRLKEGTFEHFWKISKSFPGVKEGDVLECVIEASDNRIGRPNVSQSQKFKIHIVSGKEYTEYVERQIAAGLERTSVAAQEELIGSKKVKSLIPEKK